MEQDLKFARTSANCMSTFGWSRVASTAGALAAIALPFLAKNFLIFQLTMAIIYAIAILGLTLLTGFCGQVSLGHGAFYAIGAYAAAILIGHAGFAYYVAIPIAGIICLVAGLLFALPALRLHGIYLALATFSLAIAVPQLLKWNPLAPWTGGVQGVSIDKPDAPFGLPINSDQWFYFVTLAVAALLYFFATNLIYSRSGRAILSIRENPIAAWSVGINVPLYKGIAFGLSALYTGMAGALGAIAAQFVAPDSFPFSLSISLFVGLVVGGADSIGGSLIGGLFVLFAPNVASHVTKGLEGASYGLILILVIFLMPSGCAGLIRAVIRRLGAESRQL
jgi:branched-chain amino acid transport system permease protein